MNSAQSASLVPRCGGCGEEGAGLRGYLLLEEVKLCITRQHSMLIHLDTLAIRDIYKQVTIASCPDTVLNCLNFTK